MTSRNYVSELWRRQNESVRSGSQDEFPTTRDLSVKEMESRFKRILREVSVQYISLTVTNLEQSRPIRISVDGQMSIRLAYDSDLLQYLTVKELESLLYYAACHAVAMPFNVTSCLERGARTPLLVDCFECYEEYLAHVEFLKRYRGTEIHDGLRRVHLRLLDNIETVIWNLRLVLDPDQRNRLGADLFEKLESILSSIVYDSMFFFAAGDSAFLDRCRSLNLEGLHKFVEWVYEDFEYIRNLALPLVTMVDAVITSSRLGCCVEPRCLMLRGDIVFYTHIFEFTQIEEWRNARWATDLAAAWRKRLTC